MLSQANLSEKVGQEDDETKVRLIKRSRFQIYIRSHLKRFWHEIDSIYFTMADARNNIADLRAAKAMNKLAVKTQSLNARYDRRSSNAGTS